MANSLSAAKAFRVSERKNAKNNQIRKQYKAAKKAVLDAVQKGTKAKELGALLTNAYKQFDYAAKKNTIHKNTASRYKSRLAKAVAKVS